MLPDNTILGPSESFFIVPSKESAQQISDQGGYCPGLFFDIAVGDTLRIVSPVFTPITLKEVAEIPTIKDAIYPIVINEINYHSEDEYDSEDWVEITNTDQTAIDISGYVLKDSDDDHSFSIPDGTALSSGGYLVLCRDGAAFKTVYPDVKNVVGDFTFGFGGDGDRVRMYDAGNTLIDFVSYGVIAPWPPEADGKDRTLELRNPMSDTIRKRNPGAQVPKSAEPPVRRTTL